MDVQQFAVNMKQKFSFTSQRELPDTTTYRWKLKKQYYNFQFLWICLVNCL